MNNTAEIQYHNFISSAALGLMDCSRIDREIIIPKDRSEITLGNKRDKKKLESISDLRNILSQIASYVYHNIHSESIDIGGIKFRFEIPSLNSQNPYFISQLVFDILFDKYLIESPKLTLNKYCKEHICFEWDESLDLGGDEFDKAIKSTAKMMSEELKYEAKLKNHESLRAVAEALGIAPNKYSDYINHFQALNEGFHTDKKKYKYQWDQIYYRGNNKLITYKQFRRGFQVGKHYSYGDFETGYKVYDRFVKKFIPKPNDSSKIKFFKSMDFYCLEIDKRLDFIYKLAVKMEKEGLTDIERNHPMIKRFHPKMPHLCINNDRLCGTLRNKYYRPFLFVDDVCPESKQYFKQSNDFLRIYYIVRAITYEKFNYDFQFLSSKTEEEHYADIWNFINNHYNVLNYHDPQKEWFNNEAEKYGDQVMRIKNAVKINNALFWESDAKQAPSRRNRKETE